MERLLEERGDDWRGRNDARLYLGGIYLKKGETESAIRVLSLIPEAAVVQYGEAIWYKALAKLREGDLKAANSELSEIAGDERWSLKRRTAAKDICEQLKSE